MASFLLSLSIDWKENEFNMTFSNSFLLYKKGWRGMNIDCMPNSMKIFNKKRKRDINIEAAVSDKKEKLKYYMFDEPAINGFHSKEKIKKMNSVVVNKIIIETKTLNEILEEHQIKYIDLLMIDAEGFDFKVLKSLNLNAYNPKIIIIETHLKNINEIILSEQYKYLIDKKYRLSSWNIYSLIFIKENFKF